ncbi:MAG: sialate O-acetylesterase [Rikenellaceae bacterium]
MKNLITLIFAFVGIVTQALAFEILTPSVVGNNMVVQRNSSAKIWGWAKANGAVTIVADWNSADTVRVKCDANSRFEATLETPEAGGPYTIQIAVGGKTKVIENVMSGEVWLCGGQSNMQLSLSSTWGTKVDYHKYFSTLNNPNIRIFRVPLVGSDSEQDDCRGVWKECEGSMMENTSLAAYFFAERLQAELGVAVGIVTSSWGGTNAEPWIAKEAIEANDDIGRSLESIKKPIKPSALYNAMIHPLVPYKFSGVIWYQGEANVPSCGYYDSVMRSLIESWRGDFGADLPFYFAQIAPYTYSGALSGKSPYLREQQYITSHMEGCEMIVVNDLVHDIKNIHPKDKKSVGYRFADMALMRLYGVEGVDSRYPEVEGVELRGAKIVLRLSVPVVAAADGAVSGFRIAGEDGEFADAAAKIKGNIMELSAKGIKSPKYVRYLFDDSSTCAIKGVNGLPMVPFRNDKF